MANIDGKLLSVRIFLVMALTLCVFHPFAYNAHQKVLQDHEEMVGDHPTVRRELSSTPKEESGPRSSYSKYPPKRETALKKPLVDNDKTATLKSQAGLLKIKSQSNNDLREQIQIAVGTRDKPTAKDTDAVGQTKTVPPKGQVEKSTNPPTTANNDNKKESSGDNDMTHLFLYADSHNCSGTPSKHLTAPGAQSALVKADHEFPDSVRVQGRGLAEVSKGQNGETYLGVIVEQDGCYNLKEFTRTVSFNHIRFHLHGADTEYAIHNKQQISDSLQKQFTTAADISKPHTKYVFSSTSTHYFGFQVLASAYSFLETNQTNASWIRLLTAKRPDDLAERFPTFTAPKSPETQFYAPINKPDIITKWFASKDAPHPDDTIVVVDPDSWFVNSMDQWVAPTKPKQARGQIAFYAFSKRKCQELWRVFCEKNCKTPIDLVGVPYLVKASDLKEIAPLWKYYTIKIHAKLQAEPKLSEKFKMLGLEWAKEMYAYNFASTHLGIKHEMLKELQVRDIESQFDLKKYQHTPTIHMGRAWFPNKAAAQAEKWRNEDDGGFNCGGKCIQVWCKANHSAADVFPWPLPDGLDFVSYHTLRIMHESVERFGPVPLNRTFREPKNYYKPAP